MNTGENDFLNRDLRPADTLAALSMFGVFFKRSDAQLTDAEMIDAALISASYTSTKDHESFEVERAQHLDFYEQIMIPYSRYSAAIVLFIILETRLTAECIAICKERGVTTLRPSDFRGGPLEQAKIFLSKVVAIRIEAYSEWSSIMDFRVVRDCIVHCLGQINRSRDSLLLEKLIASKSGLLRSETDLVIVSADFIYAQLRTITMFFEKLFRDFGWRP